MPEPLKNIFFTEESLTHLARTIDSVYPAFDQTAFLSLVMDDDWAARELKEKMHHTARCLQATLPAAYPEALDILMKVVPHITGFDVLTFPDFVEMFGQDDWERSLPALGYFTRFGSAEFAIRPFLDQDPERVLPYLWRWAADENADVRRLASEGSRPRLPWGMALPKFRADPTPIVPILEKLKGDESEMVRRSVANNLNDISKDHPDLVLDLCESWLGQSEEIDKAIKHACRTLLKKGNPRAMTLFGFGRTDQVKVLGLTLEPPRLPLGEKLVFRFQIEVAGKEESKLKLAYAIDFVKASGRLSRKVFHITESSYPPGRHEIQRSYTLVDMSTRKHFPGEHHLTILINGQEKALASFLVEPSTR